MNTLSNMKVATRLALGFGLTVALGVGSAGLAAWQMKRLAGEMDALANDRMVKVDLLTDSKDNMNSAARAVRNIVISRDPALHAAERKKVEEARAATVKLFAELDKRLVLPRAKELHKIVLDNAPGYEAGLDRVMDLAVKGQTDEAAKLLIGDVRTAQATIFKALDEGIDVQQAVARDAAKASGEGAARDTALLLVLTAVMAAIGGLVAWTMTRSLSRALGAEPGEVSEAVQRVAAGDLTVPVALRAGDTTSTMAAVKRMHESLSAIVGTVRGNSESVATASAQISQGNADLSQRTEEQASALQQTAATMDELSATVRHNADNARQANQLAGGASEIAERGGSVVGRVVGTMKDINDSSKKIADIIAVIDGIAFQTNILALNAAVEAARAGEQGRGFAVVAGEVRSLAQRSASAAKEIKSLITGSVEQVEQGTALVDEAGRTMDEIVGAIKRVSDIVGEISAASAEQSQGVSQVGQAVSQLDQTTQQNAALVEESAAAAESLKQQAQQLVQAVAVFRVAAAQHGAPAPAAATKATKATVVPAAVRPIASVSAPVRPAKAATPARAPMPAAPAAPAAAAVSEHDWESF